jgi:molybdopterin/thiamine biosynthesis adenylyltransferase
MMTTLVQPEPTTTAVDESSWSYTQAFRRHQGLWNAREQERIRRSRVAIAGLGGTGGIHLATLARLGIGAFHLADPDAFELANFNRQQGATMASLGRKKVDVLADQARDINPDVCLQMFPEGIHEANVAAFLDGVDVVVDAIDFFAVSVRRVLFREARRRGIWVITAGPLGCGTAWLAFDPAGMSFDDYYDLHDGQDRIEQLVAFAVGLAPRATHWSYMDLSQVDVEGGSGPSVGLACQLCAGVTAAEVVKLLLGRGRVRAAPAFAQFDAYRGVLRTGYLPWGNRHPWQRLKRWWLRRRVRQLRVV